MLLTTLKKNPAFLTLKPEQQEMFARLSHAFEQDEGNLYKAPDELAHSTQTGTKHHWQQFLSFEVVQTYIRKQMAHATQVASRKAFLSLQAEAKNGNVQAVKHINELSGILQKDEQHKTVVLHQIARPKIIQNKEETE